MSARLPAALRRCLTIALLAALAAALAPAASSAASEQNPRGRFLGVVPSKSAVASPLAPERRTPSQTLAYHHGPVVHGATVYAIYWAPPGYSFPSDYTSSIDHYFQNVAADSGKSSNVYAVARQYADGVGPTSYQVTFGGSFTDTTAFPANGCSYSGVSVCLSDAQLTGELDTFIGGHSLPRGMSNLYFLFTPAGVGSCFDGSSQQCAFELYCGYHSDFLSGSSEVLYANEPYASGVPGCDAGPHPTGTTGDGTINVVSHEHIEIATDPLGSGWYEDASGDEIADLCGFDFGTPLGTANGDDYNQSIGDGSYWLQQEWSNGNGGCVQDMGSSAGGLAPNAAFTHSGSPKAGQLVTFDGSASNDPDGQILGYAWDYGDGATGTGKFPFHSYGASGTYNVRLTVTDNDGSTATVSAPLAVAPGAATPTDAKPLPASSPSKPHAKKHKKKHKKKKKKHAKKKKGKKSKKKSRRR